MFFFSPCRSGVTTVIIKVGDINDQCPFIASSTYTGSLQQGETYVLDEAGRLIIRAWDGDQVRELGLCRTSKMQDQSVYFVTFLASCFKDRLISRCLHELLAVEIK